MTGEITNINNSWKPKKTLRLQGITDNTAQTLLEHCLSEGYRDIYLQSNDYIRGKLGTNYVLISSETITHKELIELAEQISSKGQVNQVALGKSSGGRKIISLKENQNKVRSFRYSISQISQGLSKGLDIAIRPIAEFAPTVKDVGLEKQFVNHVKNIWKGLVLIIGATGEGKTSTLAALIREVLETPSNKRILEFARPPEFDYSNLEIHPSNSICHHEIFESQSSGGDLVSYDEANAMAMRKGADWFAIGEMTEPESFRSAIVLANTGHIVSSTLHANSVSAGFARVYRMFPSDERDEVLYGLINEGEIFASQKLVDRAGGGLIAIREFLINTADSKRRLKQCTSLSSIIETVENIMFEQGTTFKQRAFSLLNSGQITKETYDKFMISI
ncbi:ATPase, T2SS/T4P/T4SS family [Aliivibrio fischeri]|uniref:Twitching motility protein PilT n=1 Tax=Aliivibrio fischeri (strain MJ11) TaxID=388396 RepID=B5EW61_ALIFM|nr:ATPase, T2SS/T4P/T4SS family [Aliivibrio fischeri]ACH64787.1 twitching motility protein PilT [Aliivibrio fischeri MJ11]MUK37613.1 twitching motility protein PilT [Aliivibrio fischeri]